MTKKTTTPKTWFKLTPGDPMAPAQNILKHPLTPEQIRQARIRTGVRIKRQSTTTAYFDYKGLKAVASAGDNPERAELVHVDLDLDHPDMATYMDSHAKGKSLISVTIYKRDSKGVRRRSLVWLDIANFYGHPEVRLIIKRKLNDVVKVFPAGPQQEC